MALMYGLKAVPFKTFENQRDAIEMEVVGW
jgi:hypothetical protein